MKAVIRREIRNYMKNPIVWAGTLAVVFMIYQILSPYLAIGYFNSQQEVDELKNPKDLTEADITDGYVPSTKEQQYELGLEEIKRELVEYGLTTGEEAETTIQEILKKNMSIEDIDFFMVQKYDYFNADYILQTSKIHKGSMEEINSYLDKKLSEQPFSYYFSLKFADFTGLFMGFLAAVLLAFLFIRDTRRDTYELLHTKPISGTGYIAGKIMGGFFSILIIIAVLVVFFTGLCLFHGIRAGLPVRIWDIFYGSIIYILPNMLMITCVYALAALVFKNPLPGAPLIFLYMIYSNMGSIGPDGRYGYYGRPLAVMVRFPGDFFETVPLELIPYNQIFLVCASLLLLAMCVWIWNKRRVY